MKYIFQSLQLLVGMLLGIPSLLHLLDELCHVRPVAVATKKVEQIG